MKREHVLAEIRRTAVEGRALGRKRFEAETGIREYDWGRFWARWGDAVREAGVSPGEWSRGALDDELLAALAADVRVRGRLPTQRELRLRRHQDPDFPNPKAFDRFGRKADLERRLAEFCRERPDLADVVGLLDPQPIEPEELDAAEVAADDDLPGYVYLLKSGRYYKVGWTRTPGRRSYELAIQLPEKATQVHVIATDDPVGIERYWHQRFADRRRNGEWFELSKADVAAFKKRKFM